MRFSSSIGRLPALACLLALALFAQPPAAAPGDRPADPPEEFSADRPGFGESAGTVAPGVLQLEGGFLAEAHALAGGTLRNISVPQPLLRIGLTRRLEMRLEADGFQRQSEASGDPGGRHSGYSDMSVGAKARVLREGPLRPAVALLVSVSLPVGSSYFSSQGIDPEFHFCWSKSLPRGLDLSGNFNFAWRTGGPQWTSERAASFQAGHGLAAGLHGYAEIYRVGPIEGDEPAHVVASGGVYRVLGANAQVDFEAGHTLAARTPSWFAGFGFAVRRPLPAFFRHRR
ncbi:MAG: transporter [Bryobacteraceae bacterium]